METEDSLLCYDDYRKNLSQYQVDLITFFHENRGWEALAAMLSARVDEKNVLTVAFIRSIVNFARVVARSSFILTVKSN